MTSHAIALEHELAGSSIVVTGGAGFIGAHLVRRLLSLGARVTVVDDMSAASARPCPDSVRLYRLRLPNPSLREILEESRATYLFHLAGEAYVPPSMDAPVPDLRNNAELTLHVLEAVRRAVPAPQLVFASSAAVYGSPTTLPIQEDTPICPISPYGVSKYAAEQYVSLYARIHGLQAAALRLFSVFGPGQRKQVIYDLIAKLRANPRELFVHGSGAETRDFIYVEDVVAAAILVMTRAPLRGESYNVASGAAVTIRDVVATVAGCLEVAPAVTFSGEVRPGDALNWLADIGRLRALGFAPSVSLSQGVARITRWFDEAADERQLGTVSR